MRDTRRSERLFFSFKYTPHRNLLAFLFLQSIFFVFFISFFRKLKTLLSKEMGSLGDELSLGQRRHSSIPTTTCVFPKKASKIMNVAVEKGCKLEEHVKKLEEEKRKIQGSELELPLCLQILNDGSSDSSSIIRRLLKLCFISRS